MSRPSVKEPVVISSKAAQRLAAIYRQHRPDQPALALATQVGKASRVEDQNGPPQHSSRVRTAVLDAPLPRSSITATVGHPTTTDWQNLRDTHSELYVTCHTLCRLQLVHGTIVEVCLPHNAFPPLPASKLSLLAHGVQVLASQDSFGLNSACRPARLQLSRGCTLPPLEAGELLCPDPFVVYRSALADTNCTATP